MATIKIAGFADVAPAADDEAVGVYLASGAKGDVVPIGVAPEVRVGDVWCHAEELGDCTVTRRLSTGDGWLVGHADGENHAMYDSDVRRGEWDLVRRAPSAAALSVASGDHVRVGQRFANPRCGSRRFLAGQLWRCSDTETYKGAVVSLVRVDHEVKVWGIVEIPGDLGHLGWGMKGAKFEMGYVSAVRSLVQLVAPAAPVDDDAASTERTSPVIIGAPSGQPAPPLRSDLAHHRLPRRTARPDLHDLRPPRNGGRGRVQRPVRRWLARPCDAVHGVDCRGVRGGAHRPGDPARGVRARSEAGGCGCAERRWSGAVAGDVGECVRQDVEGRRRSRTPDRYWARSGGRCRTSGRGGQWVE